MGSLSGDPSSKNNHGVRVHARAQTLRVVGPHWWRRRVGIEAGRDHLVPILLTVIAQNLPSSAAYGHDGAGCRASCKSLTDVDMVPTSHSDVPISTATFTTPAYERRKQRQAAPSRRERRIAYTVSLQHLISKNFAE